MAREPLGMRLAPNRAEAMLAAHAYPALLRFSRGHGGKGTLAPHACMTSLGNGFECSASFSGEGVVSNDVVVQAIIDDETGLGECLLVVLTRKFVGAGETPINLVGGTQGFNSASEMLTEKFQAWLEPKLAKCATRLSLGT